MLMSDKSIIIQLKKFICNLNWFETYLLWMSNPFLTDSQHTYPNLKMTLVSFGQSYLTCSHFRNTYVLLHWRTNQRNMWQKGKEEILNKEKWSPTSATQIKLHQEIGLMHSNHMNKTEFYPILRMWILIIIWFNSIKRWVTISNGA